LLETADTVVQSYTLPKSLHVVDPSVRNDAQLVNEEDSTMFDAQTAHLTQDEDPDDRDVEMEEIIPVPALKTRVDAPKTMQQLAEANAQELTIASLEQTVPELNLPANGTSRATRASRRSSGTPSELALARGRATRGRKRTRDLSDTSEEEDEEDKVEERPKRGKTQIKAVTTPAPPTRTLRARIPKSDEKKRKEREMEEAYRRAIAE